MWKLMVTGGPAAWVLLACGFVGLLVFLERLINLHRAQIAADDFLKGLYVVLKRGNMVEAATICEETPGPVARLALAAVLHHDEGMEKITQAVEEAGLEEIPRMERGLGWLATLARIFPILGLLGTVLGFMEMLRGAAAKAPLVQSADLTGGMWEALAATALSLALAALTYAGYNFLVSRVESILLDMERAAGALLGFMKESGAAREGSAG